ncbi:hypothetical protein ColTof3_11737 [Colletotrichum tofieldiae]|nr:hypothetical protein ColTof3_11737 [Colletotrichum tofieldiae]
MAPRHVLDSLPLAPWDVSLGEEDVAVGRCYPYPGGTSGTLCVSGADGDVEGLIRNDTPLTTHRYLLQHTIGVGTG